LVVSVDDELVIAKKFKVDNQSFDLADEESLLVERVGGVDVSTLWSQEKATLVEEAGEGHPMFRTPLQWDLAGDRPPIRSARGLN
jgi:hypothetical protein